MAHHSACLRYRIPMNRRDRADPIKTIHVQQRTRAWAKQSDAGKLAATHRELKHILERTKP
jgi:hypothetical protein